MRSPTRSPWHERYDIIINAGFRFFRLALLATCRYLKRFLNWLTVLMLRMLPDDPGRGNWWIVLRIIMELEVCFPLFSLLSPITLENKRGCSLRHHDFWSSWVAENSLKRVYVKKKKTFPLWDCWNSRKKLPFRSFEQFEVKSLNTTKWLLINGFRFLFYWLNKQIDMFVECHRLWKRN